MTQKRHLEEALRNTLRLEDTSVKERLARRADKPGLSERLEARNSAARPAAEVPQQLQIEVADSDLDRLKTCRKRIGQHHPKPDKNTLWRAGLLALEQLDADQLVDLMRALPELSGKRCEGRKAASSKKKRSA